jgi:hypothetical protein
LVLRNRRHFLVNGFASTFFGDLAANVAAAANAQTSNIASVRGQRSAHASCDAGSGSVCAGVADDTTLTVTFGSVEGSRCEGSIFTIAFVFLEGLVG